MMPLLETTPQRCPSSRRHVGPGFAHGLAACRRYPLWNTPERWRRSRWPSYAAPARSSRPCRWGGWRAPWGSASVWLATFDGLDLSGVWAPSARRLRGIRATQLWAGASARALVPSAHRPRALQRARRHDGCAARGPPARCHRAERQCLCRRAADALANPGGRAPSLPRP